MANDAVCRFGYDHLEVASDTATFKPHTTATFSFLVALPRMHSSLINQISIFMAFSGDAMAFKILSLLASRIVHQSP
jgi:hypothetical protein